MIFSNDLNTIKKCINSRSVCSFERNKIDDLTLYGIPLLISNDLLALYEIYDFEFDGIKVIRLDDITAVYHSESELFIDKILKNEQILIPDNNLKLNIDSLKDLMVQYADKFIILECEKNYNNTFYIGKIKKIGDLSVDFLNFDGLGIWDDKSTNIEYSSITCVTVKSRYLNIISKYVKADE